VTGGGLPGNLPRVVPDGLAAVVDASSWTWPDVFRWLAEQGPVEDAEMWRTFNCGVGMVLVLAPGAVDAARATLAARGVDAWVLGHVEASDGDAFRFA
jgi:phosphoribosylformylglycinamidine cyclo-ligase